MQTYTRIFAATLLLFIVAVPFVLAQHPGGAVPGQMPMDRNHLPKAVVDTTPKPIAEIPIMDTTAGWFVVETRHRIFMNFLQTDTVYFGQPFSLGEEEKDTAYIYDFNPDFTITDSGRVLQRSDSLINPAAHVRVVADGRTQQESWAFNVGGAPHFRRNYFFAFRLVEFRAPDKYIKIQK